MSVVVAIRTTLAAIIMAVLAGVAPAYAVTPDEILDDPALEERARDISLGLRCLVCQNQSIDDSDAQLAKDLRVLVRERLVAGDSDEEVLDFVVSRYGEFVLLRPQFSAQNLALWATPVLVLLLGGLAALAYARKQADTKAVTELSSDEEARLSMILGDADRRDG